MNARPKLMLIGLVVLLALGGAAGGYSWYWYRLADGVVDGLNIWLGQRRAEGFQAEAGPIEVSGYPFDIVATLGRAVLGRSGAGAWRWRGRDIEVRLSPLEPRHIRLGTTAAQTLQFSNSRGQDKTLRAKADRSEGLIELGQDGRLARLQGDFRILGLSGSALPGPLAARRLKLDIQPRGPAQNYALALSLQADALHLPKNTDPVLGDIVEIARLDATISGPPPRNWSKTAVSAWRDDGGTIEISRGRLKWGSLDTTALGTLALDQELRPLFSATGGVKDYVETITAYKKAGFITPLNAAALTIALNLQRRDAEGRISIAVSGQNGVLRVGPLAVARLEPIRFPAD